jgi:hypothetical protein
MSMLSIRCLFDGGVPGSTVTVLDGLAPPAIAMTISLLSSESALNESDRDRSLCCWVSLETGIFMLALLVI